MKGILLALSLISPAPTDPVPIAAPVPAAIVSLLPVAVADPTADALAAYEAARTALIALRDELLKTAAEALAKANEISRKLGTPGPPPPPGPGPTPPPNPNPLNARADRIRQIAVSTVPDYVGRPARAQRLATALFADISSKISQAAALNPPPADLQPFLTVEGARKAYVTRFNEEVGSEKGQWQAFSTAFAAYVASEQKAGRLMLATPADLASLFDDAAAGLAAAFATAQRGAA